MLDTRNLTSPATFEAMVSGAASVAVASAARGDQLRLLTTSGIETGYGTGNHHLDRILGELAVVQATEHKLGTALDQVTGATSSGAVVAITSGEDELDEAIMRRAAATYRRRILVLFGDTPAMPVGSEGALRSTTVIRVPAGQPFSEAWGREFGRPRILAK